jgi:hypothetical protein
MKTFRRFLLLVTFAATSAVAQTPPPPAPDIPTLAARQAKRYPQPIRVGDLIGRKALQPLESQPVLGRVAAITRRSDGGLDMVLRIGGLAGFDARPVAVPIEGIAVMGEFVAVMDFSPEQLNALPTVEGAGGAALPANDVIRMGIAKPFH